MRRLVKRLKKIPMPEMYGDDYDENEKFIIARTCAFLKNILNRYTRLDSDTFQLLCWLLGPDADLLAGCLLENAGKNQGLDQDLEEVFPHSDDFPDYLVKLAGNLPVGSVKKVMGSIIEVLNWKIAGIGQSDISDIERNLSHIKNMFQFSDVEMQMLTFEFINCGYDNVEQYFFYHMNCNSFSGRKFLCCALDVSPGQLAKMLNGKLTRIGIVDVERNCIELNPDFLPWILNPNPELFSKNLYETFSAKQLPLDYFLISPDQVQYVLRILSRKQTFSTHILLYGPPGSGKSSFAASIAGHLDSPAFKILSSSNNQSIKRQAAVLACANMTSTKQGSVIVVDEADNLLNTRHSFFSRGETQDKGWLNEFLERPGIRAIWIVNHIDDIEPSVLRRFAYSICFKPFNQRLRKQLWQQVLDKYDCGHFICESQMARLAKKYDISAGAVDMCTRKAVEMNAQNSDDFYSLITTGLDAHATLLNEGTLPVSRDEVSLEYSLDGLNLNTDIDRMLSQLQRFDHALRTMPKTETRNMNLLFYGPPGTGKSELARFIGSLLDRSILCKQASDLYSMWVGGSEKNIKSAFEQAENEDALLVIDEADTFLFHREHYSSTSWQISFTNEFLKQMERFRGILVCTTNMMDELDSASIRRFNHKAEFDYLSSRGNVIFYEKMLAPLVDTPLSCQELQELKSMAFLAPGDFKIVNHNFAFYGDEHIDHKTLIRALMDEVRIKKANSTRRAGF